MSGVFTLARNSASSGFFLFVKPCTSALDWFKQESDQLLGIGACLHGADAETRVPPVPVAGDDAAADAGDQAAAAVESRLVGFRRRGTGAQPPARTGQRRSRTPGRGRADPGTFRIWRLRRARRDPWRGLCGR